MANTPKVDMITSFSGGEFTPALAGHVDFEAYKSGSRFLENLIPEVQGGLKKFYGTREVAVLSNPSDYKMVPFDGQDDPIVLVFHDGIISVIDGDDYYDTDLTTNIHGFGKLTWAQQNSVIYFAHPGVPPFSIRCLGRGDDLKMVFVFEDNQFVDVPYFPLGWKGNFNGTITTNGNTGTVEVEAQRVVSTKLKLPAFLEGASGGKNVLIKAGAPYIPVLEINALGRGGQQSTRYTVNYGTTTVSLIRRRNGVETVVTSVNTGVVVTDTTQQSRQS